MTSPRRPATPRPAGLRSIVGHRAPWPHARRRSSARRPTVSAFPYNRRLAPLRQAEAVAVAGGLRRRRPPHSCHSPADDARSPWTPLGHPRYTGRQRCSGAHLAASQRFRANPRPSIEKRGGVCAMTTVPPSRRQVPHSVPIPGPDGSPPTMRGCWRAAHDLQLARVIDRASTLDSIVPRRTGNAATN